MNQVLSYIRKYFNIWWIPVCANFIPILIFTMGVVCTQDWIIDLSLLVFFLNVIGTVISGIVQVVNGKWYFVFPQLGILGILIYFTAIIFTYSPFDYYGTFKVIPDDLNFSEPLDSMPSNQDFLKHDFVLMNFGQPGIYKYFTDYVPKEKGAFYVKAFEITSNDHLSADRMKERSMIQVDSLGSVIHEGEFTIYEGDWGDEYGARIELWYIPLNGGREYKICERFYIVEGWQR